MPWTPPEDSQKPGDAVNATDESAPREDLKTQLSRRRRQTIVDGPFTESKELFGGQWPPSSVRW